MENNIPSAKEFLENRNIKGDMLPILELALIDFAKLHVKNALLEASNDATMILEYPNPYKESNEIGLKWTNAEEISRGGEGGTVEIDDKSILNAYPENLIK